MKQFISISIIILAISLGSCSSKTGKVKQMAHEDSIRLVSDRAYRAHLLVLQKVREDLIGPEQTGDVEVTKGEKFKTNLLDDPTNLITGGFEKLKAKLEKAQKDSSSPYGALMTRFRLLNSQHKYLTATYTEDAHLLRYTAEITLDDKHEEDRDFYFNNGELVYFRERHTFTQEELDFMTDDSYFLRNGKVIYAYRDEGSAQERKDKMNVIPTKRFLLKGDLTAHVSKEFEKFKQDYEILLTQPLEPLIYPGESPVQ